MGRPRPGRVGHPGPGRAAGVHPAVVVVPAPG
ncbi:hypothetical protein STVIR_4561 [Streptomyces viridochromogenes Tue57]|uniref:Uncharacterized protein n=1 Tax=Streptomyces viridochromogenes Tue57 TaxID=1160705 RepID=L8PGH0_STRVR|nr:hypothetical protein STVIR_4561 [Streptomyces viridochromogenes Tue57]